VQRCFGWVSAQRADHGTTALISARNRPPPLGLQIRLKSLVASAGCFVNVRPSAISSPRMCGDLRDDGSAEMP
jgi:hypothetical protein